MEEFKDTAIVLSARMHGENAAVVSVLCEENGRYAGYLSGARSKANRALIEPGAMVTCFWKSRISENLGSWRFEGVKSYSALILQDSIKLAALQSACALCDQALPEREGHPGLFNGLGALLNMIENDAHDVWASAYVYWEIALLKELGFGLELTKCVAGGEGRDLVYVSPKSGGAVSREKGAPYKDKLLLLPQFLRPQGGDIDDEQVLIGLKMTGHFLQNWAFAQHSYGIPDARLIFQERFDNLISQ